MSRHWYYNTTELHNNNYAMICKGEERENYSSIREDMIIMFDGKMRVQGVMSMSWGC